LYLTKFDNILNNGCHTIASEAKQTRFSEQRTAAVRVALLEDHDTSSLSCGLFLLSSLSHTTHPFITESAWTPQ
jgi:hypothetical protein